MSYASYPAALATVKGLCEGRALARVRGGVTPTVIARVAVTVAWDAAATVSCDRTGQPPRLAAPRHPAGSARPRRLGRTMGNVRLARIQDDPLPKRDLACHTSEKNRSMSKKALRLDEIGYWSEVKLDIVKKYARAYSTILAKNPSIKRHIYIDAFAGAGQHISRTTGDFVSGSPLNALQIAPPFKELHFIDLDGGKASELRKRTAGHERVTVHQGDCNDVLLRRVFPRCQYTDRHRGLCLLDPYGLNVDWQVLQAAGQR